jgi:hypothetical protein
MELICYSVTFMSEAVEQGMYFISRLYIMNDRFLIVVIVLQVMGYYLAC